MYHKLFERSILIIFKIEKEILDMNQYYIYGITRDDGDTSDLDAAIDRYYYHKYCDGVYCGDLSSPRQYLVDRVKEGSLAYTYPDEHIGALCEVKVSQYGTEYLKTIPDGNPKNNISALPEM